jgi:alanine racemase
VAVGLRPEEARVDLTRLASNFRAIEAFAERPLMPVVKADAYGHGAARVSLLLQELGAPLLAVAFVEEGVPLRLAGVKVPIVLTAGTTVDESALVAEHRLTPAVGSPRALEGALAACRRAEEPLAVHLKIDTGMTRLGFAPEEAPDVASRLARGGAHVEGALTHLSTADDDPKSAERQLDRFDAALADLARHGVRPRWVHAVNSAGLLHLRPSQTLVRPGLLVYGLRPRPRSPEIDVRPVMTLAGRVDLVRSVPAGTAVSYGARWIAPRPSRIATVSVGYADGVPRTTAMEAHGELRLAAGRAPVVGTVCMDFTMLDVTDRPEVAEGDEAVVFGDDPTAWEVADWAGTNAWEVLTSVGLRVPRVYLEAGRVVEVLSRY